MRTSLNNEHQLWQPHRKFFYIVPVVYAPSSDVIDLHSSVPDAEAGASCRAMNKRTTTNAKHHGECVDPNDFNPLSVRNSITRCKDG